MSGYLVDTSVVSLWVNARTGGSGGFGRLDQMMSAGDLVVSIITIFEIDRGLALERLHGKSKRKTALVAMLIGRWTVVSLDAVLPAAAMLWAHAQFCGRPIADADLLIASTALAIDATLLTADAKLATALAALGKGPRVETWPPAGRG